MVRHMFGTRVGGVSEGKYATVNFSYTLGDRRECVDENYRRAARILTRDGDIGRFVVGRQTHTTNVRVVTEEDRGKGVTREQDYQDVDALITNVPGLVLTTFHADCPPVYIVDPGPIPAGRGRSEKSHAVPLNGWRRNMEPVRRTVSARSAPPSVRIAMKSAVMWRTASGNNTGTGSGTSISCSRGRSPASISWVSGKQSAWSFWTAASFRSTSASQIYVPNATAVISIPTELPVLKEAIWRHSCRSRIEGLEGTIMLCGHNPVTDSIIDYESASRRLNRRETLPKALEILYTITCAKL